MWFYIDPEVSLIQRQVYNSFMLFGDVGGFILCQVFTLTNLIEKFATIAQLGDKIDLMLVLIDLVKAHNVRVCQVL